MVSSPEIILCACGCGKVRPPDRRGKFPLHLVGHGTSIGLPPIGKKFSRLTVIGDSDKRRKGGRRYWFFRCDCGTVKEQAAAKVVAGDIRSCGCLKREAVKAANSKYEDPLQKWRNALAQQYRCHAAERGLEFALTSVDVSDLCRKPCVYCGRMNVSQASKHYKGMLPHNGIDRVDSRIGYVLGNVVTCCKACNIMKQRMSVDEFMSHLRLILSHHQERSSG